VRVILRRKDAMKRVGEAEAGVLRRYWAVEELVEVQAVEEGQEVRMAMTPRG